MGNVYPMRMNKYNTMKRNRVRQAVVTESWLYTEAPLKPLTCKNKIAISTWDEKNTMKRE